ncbi:MAG TPA: PmoA family protein [Verrucomicrobiales bacterium]|nr:PmoA family protein [Verrucomicrobiales bacterium]
MTSSSVANAKSGAGVLLWFPALFLLAAAPRSSFGGPVPEAPPPGFEVRRIQEHALDLIASGNAVLRYVFRDPVIRRPYFTDARTPSGVLVTRNHPPVEGTDATDHADMHPGVWLAFGDLNGFDFWRNRAAVRHDGYIVEPAAGPEEIAFTVRNLYLDGERQVCREESAFRFRRSGTAFMLDWDSRFMALDEELVFGDQEEMGLGVRVATPIAVRQGGRMRDGEGRVDEKEIWGKPSDWCDYAGEVDGRQVGIALVPHRENPRRSRFHARDYGVLVANPCALKAFGEPVAMPLRVAPGETLRLRFRIVLHDGDYTPD